MKNPIKCLEILEKVTAPLRENRLMVNLQKWTGLKDHPWTIIQCVMKVAATQETVGHHQRENRLWESHPWESHPWESPQCGSPQCENLLWENRQWENHSWENHPWENRPWENRTWENHPWENHIWENHILGIYLWENHVLGNLRITCLRRGVWKKPLGVPDSMVCPFLATLRWCRNSLRALR